MVIRARPVGDRAIIRIIDRGPGIPEAERERIFEPFYRSTPQGAGGHPGPGLGLAIAKGFVETNGGRISVESSEDQGKHVRRRLPLAPGRTLMAGSELKRTPDPGGRR